ncbi:hypothetical protein lerEdw1_011845 [Lerista edwardsae]|nr:hypothetical protein lerEdw1_011845 [Lerista edwardsae]
MADRVLVIGSGARENALAWKLAQSPHVKQVMVAPGNAGTANNGKISNSAVLISNHTILAQFCKDHNIGLVIAGPEALLAAGKIKNIPFLDLVLFLSGVLQIELMLTKDGVKVISLKCHFGDPQCQVVLQLLKSDLYEVMQATINGRLCDFMPTWSDNCTAVSVVMASEEYPECCSKGQEIIGLLQAKELGLEVFHGATTIQDGKVVTNGGRVLTITAAKKDLMLALEDAYKGLTTISFQGATYRNDVGYRALRFLGQSVSPSYEKRIADSTACSVVIQPSKLSAASRFRSVFTRNAVIHMPLAFMYFAGSCGHQGSMPSFFDLRASGYSDPILVSQTKGIGTKLKIAQLCNKHEMIGQDLVAMCINDILVQGAEPLFFLDYFATGKLDVGIAQAVTDGIAEACKRAGCTLLGSEANDTSSVCSPGEYDLVGFAVGAVERGMKLPQQERMVDGDILIGVASSGLHSQGFSLVRKILLTSSLHYFSPVPGGCGGQTLGELLLTPTKIYSKALLPVLHSGNVKAYINVADGGLLGSFPQILPEKFSVVLDAYTWKIPELFSWLHKEGRLSEGEMAQMFNCGLGAILVVQKEAAGLVLKDVQKNEDACMHTQLSLIPLGHPRVAIKNLLEALLQSKSPFLWNISDAVSPLQTTHTKSKVKVAVLISGTGTSLAALLTYTKEPASCAQVVIVIANRSGVEELKNATRAGIPTRVIDHKLFGSRSEYDGTIDKVLEEFSVELICLAGFMRVLTSNFRRKWSGKQAVRVDSCDKYSKKIVAADYEALPSVSKPGSFNFPGILFTIGKILSTYPSLSPLSKGAHKQGLPSPENIAGCTVHFVVDDAHLEAVILQEPVSVKTEDTEETLSEKVKEAESRAFPIALQLVASGMVQLGADGKTYWKRERWNLSHHQERQSCSSSYLQ